MNVKLVEVVGVLLMLAGLFFFGMRVGANHTQVKWDKEKVVQLAAQAEADHEARVLETKYQTNLTKAQNEQTQRIHSLEAANSALAAKSVSLSDRTTTFSRQLSDLTLSAVSERTSALGALFDECQKAYGEMVRHADGHASSQKTLMDSWPSN
jgi:hypothetical protein